MKIERDAPTIVLGMEETMVAMAYLGETQTFDELATQLVSKHFARGMGRVHFSNQFPDENPDDILKRESPELFTTSLSYDHRAPLLGAFVLCAEGEEPTQPDALEGFDPVVAVELAKAAKAVLLELR